MSEECVPILKRSESLDPHPGVPAAMFGPQAILRLWENYKITVYHAMRKGLTPSQAVAIFEDRAHLGLPEKKARQVLDRLIETWRRERCR